MASFGVRSQPQSMGEGLGKGEVKSLGYIPRDLPISWTRSSRTPDNSGRLKACRGIGQPLESVIQNGGLATGMSSLLMHE